MLCFAIPRLPSRFLLQIRWKLLAIRLHRLSSFECARLRILFMIFTKRRLLSRNIFHTPIVIKNKLVTFNLDSFCCFECLHIYPVFLHFSVIYLFTFYLLCLFVSVRLLAFSLFFILFFLYLFFICFCSVGQHCLRFIDFGQNGGLASQPR